MAKVKTSKKDTFIDMTAMSDVTVLLLTFFMLTANFIPLEPVQVVTPASVIETKVPDYNFVTILVDPQGHVFLNLDRPGRQAGSIGEDGRTLRHRVHRTGEGEFRRADHLCRRAMKAMKQYLQLDLSQRKEFIRQFEGIPADSTNNQLATWLKTAGRQPRPDYLRESRRKHALSPGPQRDLHLAGYQGKPIQSGDAATRNARRTLINE